MEFIRIPFGYLLEYLYKFTSNYGLSLILFSLIVKLILLPFSAKSKKSMMKMSRLQPQLKQLELACGGDKQKLQQEQMALYKEEGVSMFGGCLWSFLPLLFLLPLYTVIREPLKYLMHLDEDVITKLSEKATAALGEGKRLSAYWQYDYAKDIQTMGAGIVPADVESLNFSFLGIDLGKVPSWHIWEAKSWSDVGGFLLPVISGALSWLTMFVSQKMNNTVVRDENGEQTDAAASSTQTNKVMNLLMPLMSVVFGFMWPLGLSIYWLAQSAFGIVQDVVLTKHYRKVYDAEDKVKRQKAAERAAEEAEKERIRAARRAANPDGITENTSKKKQQLREKQEREKAAKEYDTRMQAEQGDVPEAPDAEGADANRPYRRGRAYSADHYAGGEEEKE